MDFIFPWQCHGSYASCIREGEKGAGAVQSEFGLLVFHSCSSSHFCSHFCSRWWASSSDTLIYPSIFTYPLLPLHHWSTTTHSDHTITLTLAWHSHLLHRTDLAYLMDTWFTIHICLLLFLVSPTCTLPWSNQCSCCHRTSQLRCPCHVTWTRLR